MNIVKKLTLRNLKLNRKRTIVTILGIIISVAMMTAVSVFFPSFQDLVIREEISRSGEWHTKYQDVPIEKVDVINNDVNTKFTVLSKGLGFAYLEKSKNEKKPYLYVKAVVKNGFETTEKT